MANLLMRILPRLPSFCMRRSVLSFLQVLCGALVDKLTFRCPNCPTLAPASVQESRLTFNWLTLFLSPGLAPPLIFMKTAEIYY